MQAHALTCLGFIFLSLSALLPSGILPSSLDGKRFMSSSKLGCWPVCATICCVYSFACYSTLQWSLVCIIIIFPIKTHPKSPNLFFMRPLKEVERFVMSLFCPQPQSVAGIAELSWHSSAWDHFNLFTLAISKLLGRLSGLRGHSW